MFNRIRVFWLRSTWIGRSTYARLDDGDRLARASDSILSEESEKLRARLLIASGLVVLVGEAQIVPAKIPVLDISLAPSERDVVLNLLRLGLVYLLVSFVASLGSDAFRRRVSDDEPILPVDDLRGGDVDENVRLISAARARSQEAARSSARSRLVLVVLSRRLIDVWLPLGAGVLALLAGSRLFPEWLV